MPGQEQQRPKRRSDEADEVEGEVPTPPPAAQESTGDVDALLDEIDEVLETNSEEFVRGFVQKGGQ